MIAAILRFLVVVLREKRGGKTGSFLAQGRRSITRVRKIRARSSVKIFLFSFIWIDAYISQRLLSVEKLRETATGNYHKHIELVSLVRVRFSTKRKEQIIAVVD